MFDFDALFNAALDSCSAFAMLGLAWGKAKIAVEGDVAAHEVEEYLERRGVHSDCYPFSQGVIAAVAAADEPRARHLLESWLT